MSNSNESPPRKKTISTLRDRQPRLRSVYNQDRPYRRCACCSAKSSHHFSRAAWRCVSTHCMRSFHVITRRHGTTTVFGRVQRGICGACEASEKSGRQPNKAKRQKTIVQTKIFMPFLLPKRAVGTPIFAQLVPPGAVACMCSREVSLHPCPASATVRPICSEKFPSGRLCRVSELAGAAANRSLLSPSAMVLALSRTNGMHAPPLSSKHLLVVRRSLMRYIARKCRSFVVKMPA
jgi:hypothetical protein